MIALELQQRLNFQLRLRLPIPSLPNRLKFLLHKSAEQLQLLQSQRPAFVVHHSTKPINSIKQFITQLIQNIKVMKFIARVISRYFTVRLLTCLSSTFRLTQMHLHALKLEYLYLQSHYVKRMWTARVN